MGLDEWKIASTIIVALIHMIGTVIIARQNKNKNKGDGNG